MTIKTGKFHTLYICKNQAQKNIMEKLFFIECNNDAIVVVVNELKQCMRYINIRPTNVYTTINVSKKFLDLYVLPYVMPPFKEIEYINDRKDLLDEGLNEVLKH